MEWLEMYLHTERVMREVAERGKDQLSDSLCDILDNIGAELSPTDRVYLRSRSGIVNAVSLDRLPLPQIEMDRVPTKHPDFIDYWRPKNVEPDQSDSGNRAQEIQPLGQDIQSLDSLMMATAIGPVNP